MKLLLPIKSKYAQRIIAGEKKYEYRKVSCSKKVKSLLLYNTAPIKKIVAEVEVLDTFKGTPRDVWEKTKVFAGISEKDYFEYYKNHEFAVVFSLGKVEVFDPEKDLIEYGVSHSPQSYVYI